MKDGPDIVRIAALIGDPARANILTALMSGKALTATELSGEAGVTPQTASSHLKKLMDGGLIVQRPSGRHRYYTLSGEEEAHTLEGLMGLAAGQGHLRTRTGPRDAALREARVCYNHLAGERGVTMFRSMRQRGFFHVGPNDITLTPEGTHFVETFGVALDDLKRNRAPMCRECLDWSARESHLAGKLGRAMLTRMLEHGWARRAENSRAILFSDAGKRAFAEAFMA
ncbi:MAG: ArsR/SmtB family transcription factor [Paracoccaceae bacterium]